jgi:hypothetical protein
LLGVKLFQFNTILISLSCNVTKSSITNYFWGEVIEENTYLYTDDSLTSVVEGELSPGSIILFGEVKGDFQEIFLDNPKGGLVIYRLYRPKFRRIATYTTGSNHMEKLLKTPIEANRIYSTGDRGGCFYTNSKGNKIYVDKGFCGTNVKSETQTEISTPKYNTNSSSSGGNTNVKGHYRTTKSGKTTYVKPHTRKKN